MTEKFTNTNFSYYDPGQIFKNVHNPGKKSFDVSDADSLITKEHDRIEATYNTNNDPTSISYYKDINKEITEITCIGDSAGSLNNKYFILYSARDATLYHVWYNVDSGGTDPEPTGSTGIEISIQSNDVKEIVAAATRLNINLNSDFTVTSNKEVVTINTSNNGVTTVTSDNNTGFSFKQLQAGSEELIDTIVITYSSSGNPIYKEQELKGLKYNIFSSRFELVPNANSYDFSLRSIRVTTSSRNNTVQCTKTTIGDSTASLIDLPEDSGVCKLIYNSVNTLWIGGNENITAEGDDSFPILSDEYFDLTLLKGNCNEFYAISSSGNIDVYVYGEIRE